MRFASLGSGSKGNATLVETDAVCVLVDCGFSVNETVKRLKRLGRAPEEIDAILVTHEHGDHIRGVAPFARRYATPVWLTRGTAVMARDAAVPAPNWIRGYAPFSIGDLAIQPYPVPHDAREPCQFLFGHSGRRLGLLTDTGTLTPHILSTLARCDALILEFNHDERMLAEGPYPPHLKRRVGGDYGHLSNRQAQQLLESIDLSALQCLVAAHLSEKNNDPDRVRAILDACRLDSACQVACQTDGFDWLACC